MSRHRVDWQIQDKSMSDEVFQEVTEALKPESTKAWSWGLEKTAQAGRAEFDSQNPCEKCLA